MKHPILLFLLTLTSPLFSQGTWIPKANYPGTAVLTGVGFTIGSKGYLATGINTAGNCTNELYEYDPATDVWTVKASMPGNLRHFAVGFVIAGKAYVGTGLNSPVYMNDFWAYDPIADAWTQVANVPGQNRATGIGFACYGKGYVGGGGNASAYLCDLYEYDPITNVWTTKSNFTGVPRGDMERPFVIGNKMYIGNGYNVPVCYHDFWCYDVLNDTWTQKANFPGTPRFGSTGFAICDYGYYGFGQDINTGVFSDLWRYNPSGNSWTQMTSFPNPMVDAPAFVINDTAYIGPGQIANQFYAYAPTPCSELGVNEIHSGDDYVSVYPNPTTGNFTVHSMLAQGEMEIYNSASEKIFSEKITSTTMNCNIENLPKGIYFLKLIGEQGVLTTKLVKR